MNATLGWSLLIFAVALIMVCFVFPEKKKESYANQVVHGVAGGIAGPISEYYPPFTNDAVFPHATVSSSPSASTSTFGSGNAPSGCGCGGPNPFRGPRVG